MHGQVEVDNKLCELPSDNTLMNNVGAVHTKINLAEYVAVQKRKASRAVVEWQPQKQKSNRET